MTRTDRLDPALLRMIVVLLLGGLMGLADGTIVNVGVDRLATTFQASLSTISWVASGYLLAVTVAIPFTAWSVDRFGGRRMWLIGLSIFTVGSLLSGLAWDVGSLIAFRVLQGLGGGMLDPIMLTLLARAAGPGRVGRVMGLMGIVIPLGPVIGPIVGGLILQDLDWRWMFFVNLPVGLLALVASLRVVPSEPPSERPSENRLDVVGLALLAPGFAVVVFALSRAAGGGAADSTAMIVALVLGAALLVFYVVHALRAGRKVLIDVRLFAGRSFSASVVVMGLTGIMLFSSLFAVPLYYQLVRGHDVLAAGLLLAPLGLGSFVAMPLAGRLSDRIGTRRLVPCGGLAIALAALVFTQADAAASEVVLALCSLLTGLGLGFVGAPTMGSLYRTLPGEKVPEGTSALFIVNQVGASLGITVTALVLQQGADGAAAGIGAFQDAFWWVFAAALGVFSSGFLLPGKAPVSVPEEVPQDPATRTAPGTSCR